MQYALRFVKWYFLSFIFNFSVSSLFLLQTPSTKLYCVSVTCESSADFQEEDHDGGLIKRKIDQNEGWWQDRENESRESGWRMMKKIREKKEKLEK